MSGEATAKSLGEGCGRPGARQAGVSGPVAKGRLHPTPWPTWLPGESCTGNRALGNLINKRTRHCFQHSVVVVVSVA